MNRTLRWAGAGAALIMLLAVSLAMAAKPKPTTIIQGNLVLTVNGDFFPKTVKKKTYSPVGFWVSAALRTKDGSHPPALKAFNIEADKNGYVDTTGYPICRSGQIQARNSEDALRVCGKALVGKGTTTVEVAFRDQAPVDVKSELLAFNGGTKGGKTTLYIHAFFNAPITGAIVTTVKIKKIRKGRYGTLAVSSIPVIANGAGSVTYFKLTINKRFTYRGKKRSVINARCADGKALARGEALFYDDPTKIKAALLRTCTGK